MAGERRYELRRGRLVLDGLLRLDSAIGQISRGETWKQASSHIAQDDEDGFSNGSTARGIIRPAVITTYSITELCADAATCLIYIA